MFGTFMPVLFMIGVWKCHLDTWFCTSIILKHHMCGLVEGMWVQLMAMKMFGLVMSLFFMIRVWKCHLDTWFCTNIILTHHVMWVQLYKYHFDTSHVWFGGGHVGTDDGYEDVWISHVIVVHDRGLEVSS
jgi:hypothetical protein